MSLQSRRHQPRPVSLELPENSKFFRRADRRAAFFSFFFFFLRYSSAASRIPSSLRCRFSLRGVLLECFFFLNRHESRHAPTAQLFLLFTQSLALSLSLASSSSEPLSFPLSASVLCSELSLLSLLPVFLPFPRSPARFSVSNSPRYPRLAQLVPGYIPSFGPSLPGLLVSSRSPLNTR